MAVKLNEILLTNSPYFLSYNNIASAFDYVVLRLIQTLPNGSRAVLESNDVMKLVAYKVNQSDDFVKIDISDYIKRYLNPMPDYSFFYSSTPKFSNEIIYWTFCFDAYKIDNPIRVERIYGNNRGATLGYGLYKEGVNPSLPSTLIIDNSNRFSNTKFRTFNLNLSLNPTLRDGGIVRSLTTDYMPVCTGKYNGKQILFLNRAGVYDSFLFPKSHNRSLKTRSENYYKMQDSSNFNPNYHNKVDINKNALVEWSFNTDLLDNYNVKVLEELIVSERYFLVDYEKEAFIPLLLTSTDFDQKKRINDRSKMNYTLNFEEASDYKNNVKI